MCRGCKWLNRKYLYMCMLCGGHANTREGVVHMILNERFGFASDESAHRFVEYDKNNGIETRLLDGWGCPTVGRSGACPATGIERNPNYNDDGSSVDTSENRFVVIIAAIILTLALVRFMYELGELFLPSFPPVEGTLHSALLPVLWPPPVRDGAATFFHKCLEWIS